MDADKRTDGRHVVDVRVGEQDRHRLRPPLRERLLDPVPIEARIDDERVLLALSAEEKTVGEKRPELEPQDL
jgi:hypothetical protein